MLVLHPSAYVRMQGLNLHADIQETPTHPRTIRVGCLLKGWLAKPNSKFSEMFPLLYFVIVAVAVAQDATTDDPFSAGTSVPTDLVGPCQQKCQQLFEDCCGGVNADPAGGSDGCPALQALYVRSSTGPRLF